jgi:hypothetical protein
MRNLTLAQALQYNKAKVPTNRQSTLQIKNWYKQNYYLKANGRWCCKVSLTREARKYSTH